MRKASIITLYFILLFMLYPLVMPVYHMKFTEAQPSCGGDSCWTSAPPEIDANASAKLECLLGENSTFAVLYLSDSAPSLNITLVNPPSQAVACLPANYTINITEVGGVNATFDLKLLVSESPDFATYTEYVVEENANVSAYQSRLFNYSLDTSSLTEEKTYWVKAVAFNGTIPLNESSACQLLVVGGSFDFLMELVEPATGSITVHQGETATYTVRITLAPGQSGGRVYLHAQISGTPFGWDVGSVCLCQSNPQVDVDVEVPTESLAPDTYQIQITGQDYPGDHSHSVRGYLVVQPPPPEFRFTVDLTLGETTPTQGELVPCAVTVTRTSAGGEGTVRLTLNIFYDGHTYKTIQLSPVSLNDDNPSETIVYTLNTSEMLPREYTLQAVGECTINGVLVRVSSPERTMEVQPPPPPFDFRLVLNPQRVEVYSGSSVDVLVVASWVSGSPREVQLSLQGYPAEVDWSFNQTVGTPTATSNFTALLTLNIGQIEGTYQLQVVATSGTTRKTANLTLTVMLPPSNFVYQISIEPPSKTIPRGETAIFTIKVSLISGDPEEVQLEISGLPSGVDYELEPTYGTPQAGSDFVSTLSIITSEKAKPGTYNITVTAVPERAEQKTVSIELTIKETAPIPFLIIGFTAIGASVIAILVLITKFLAGKT